MSNIHTFREITEQSENSSPLPPSWADRRTVALEDSEYGYHAPQQSSQVAYLDMNGEPKTTVVRSRLGGFCWVCCTCFMDPCSTERRQEYLKSLKSFSVIAMIIQIIYFIVCLAVGGFAPPRLNPMLGPPGSTLLKMGAMYAPYIRAGQVQRFVTPILMHAGLIHLFSNMYVQWRFGLMTERRWGTWRFAVIYMVSGIAGALASALRGKDAISVGASGALMGVMGAFLLELAINWTIQLPNRVSLLAQIGTYLLIGIVMGLLPGVDLAAHAAGAIAGFVTSAAVNAHLNADSKRAMTMRIASIVALSLYFLIGTICFFTVVKVAKTS